MADEAEAELSSLAETAARAFTLNKPLLFLIPLKADKAIFVRTFSSAFVVVFVCARSKRRKGSVMLFLQKKRLVGSLELW
jgi:hypothetical protein